jgi:hypothetical protein
MVISNGFRWDSFTIPACAYHSRTSVLAVEKETLACAATNVAAEKAAASTLLKPFC